VVLAVVLGALGIAVLYQVNPTVHEFFGGRLTLTNAEARSGIIATSVDKIAERPLLGFGAGVTPDNDPNLERAHNTYLQQVLAFGLFLGVVVSLALWSLAGFFLVRGRSNALAGVVGYTILVQLVIFLFESSFEGTVLRVIFYLSVAMAVGLLRAVEAEPAASEP
jgi:O-antigen ligase